MTTDILKALPIFEGIHEEDLLKMLECLGGYEKKFQKNDFL